MKRYEVLQRTILEFKQWPGNNPWSLGGEPILGNAGVSIISISGLFTLLFGAFWGLRLAVVAHLFIGFWGAWKLSRIWWHNRFVRLIFCFYLIANPAMIYHLTVGHLVYLNFYFFPLILYYLLRFREDIWSGLKAGLITALAINDSPAYIPQYILLILAGIFIYLFVTNYKRHWRYLLNWALLFVPVLATLSIYRIIMILQVISDYPRITNRVWHYSLKTVLEAYLVPHTKLVWITKGIPAGRTTWEICSYVGITGFILSIRNLSRGFRWWHAMIILLVWAAAGNDNYFYIMYWIRKIPGFSSHLCFARIRVFALVFFGIAAICELNHLGTKYKDKGQNTRFRKFICIGILLVGEVLLVSHIIMWSSHPEPIVQSFYAPNNKFQNVRTLPHLYKYKCWTTYEAMKMNLGWLNGSGVSNLPGKCARLDRDDPNYIAEFHQDNTPVEPVYWSPNRILFENLDPAVPLIINMNPGKPWYCNGIQIFPEYRIVEHFEPFHVMPNSKGVVELVYKYPAQKLALTATAVLMIISCVIIIGVSLCKSIKPQKNMLNG